MTYEEIEVNDDLYSYESDAFRREAQVGLPLETARIIAKGYLRKLNSGDLYDTEEALRDIRELIERVIAQDEISATADQWHNFSVDLARCNLYDLACDLLECALSGGDLAHNTDLLADYLQYGVSCGRSEQCHKYYRILDHLPRKRWNWRAYSFTILYLGYLWGKCSSTREIDRLESEMNSLADEYCRTMPDNEESFRSKAYVFHLLNRPEDEEMVLRFGLSRVKKAPKCALSLADILFDRGDDAEALEMVRRSLDNSNKTVRTVNEGYLKFMSGLLQIELLRQNGGLNDEEKILGIYADFNSSLQYDRHASYSGLIRNRVIDLCASSGIDIPERFSELDMLVN